MSHTFAYHPASPSELALRWERDIADNLGDSRWVRWSRQNILDNDAGVCRNFVAVCSGEPMPIGTGTLIFSPECGAIGGRLALADGVRCANINALRVDKAFEGQGHISRLVRVMEAYARDAGHERLTIGVEARESRNLGIYLHWGYDEFLMSEVEDGELVLYYSKDLR